MAALEQVTTSISSRRGRMSRADIWREVDRLQARLSTLRGENQEGETTVVVQAEAIPDNLQGGALGGQVQVARPIDAVRNAGPYQLSFNPNNHFAVAETLRDGTVAADSVAPGGGASGASVQVSGTTNGAPPAAHPRSA